MSGGPDMSDFDAADAQYAAAHGGEELAAAGVLRRGYREFMANEPPKRDWLVTGVIAKGMKGDLNAKSKCRKSFFGLQLAYAVATGRDFLGMPVPRARRVVYFNLELDERGLWERFAAIERAAGVKPEDGMLSVYNLRGKADRLRGHTPALVAEMQRLGIDLIVLDPRYKLIAEGEDENSAAGLRGVLAFRDALAEAAAVLMIGHDPKGDTAGKGIVDRGAGSYTAGADYDFAFALSPHEEDGKSVLQASCRYCKTPPDLTLRFDEERQVFEAEADTPAVVRAARRAGGGGANADPKEKAERNAARLDALKKAVREIAARDELMSMGTFRTEVSKTAAGAALSKADCRDALDALLASGEVIAKTREKMRTEGGGVKCVKNGDTFVGSPERVREYDAQFEGLPL